MDRTKVRCIYITVALVFNIFILGGTASAAPPRASIVYQPMTSHGLAAGYPFESWIVFQSTNPSEPGYSLPAGAEFRFKFPDSFNPQPTVHPEAVLLYGWPQKAAPVAFAVGLDPLDPRAIILTLKEPFPGPPKSPGFKAIHLRFGPLNPGKEGDYPIVIQISNAGELSGTVQAIAQITPKPVPVIAAYNQLHQGRNEDWQVLKTGKTAPIPIDLLVTLPDRARSSVSLRSMPDGNLEVLSDGLPIGTITRRGAPIMLKPEPFGPGFARLGIVRFHMTAGAQPGVGEILAQLQGGPPYTLHVVVQPSDKLAEKQAKVAQKGALIMPFSLDQTRHTFNMVNNGGIQSVVAKDPLNRTEIELIRKHLWEESEKFRRGDFSDPEKIHGSNMPGLADLKAGFSKIDIRYRDLPNGAQINYSTNDPRLVEAIHHWFMAQLSEHGKHAASH